MKVFPLDACIWLSGIGNANRDEYGMDNFTTFLTFQVSSLGKTVLYNEKYFYDSLWMTTDPVLKFKYWSMMMPSIRHPWIQMWICAYD